MEPYKNLGGDSGVVAYQVGSDFIEVKFKDGWIYSYTHASAGVENVQAMKKLAHEGQGLNSFINIEVKDKYESKRR